MGHDNADMGNDGKWSAFAGDTDRENETDKTEILAENVTEETAAPKRQETGNTEKPDSKSDADKEQADKKDAGKEISTAGNGAGAEEPKKTAPRKRGGRKPKAAKTKPEAEIKDRAPKQAEPIWDDMKDTNKEVARLYGQGMDIIEIANQLGIGVGEARTVINKLKKR